MALREDQILRYSRQILLREVGGVGQERLLGATVLVDVADAPGLTAAAYLAAAGSGLTASPRPLAPAAPGFLAAATQVGQRADAVLAHELLAFNADAVPQAAPAAQLAELPAGFEGAGPWVALGAQETRGAVVFRAPGACPACFAAACAQLAPPPASALGVALGALGALVLQRLVLGLGPSSGLLLLAAPGALEHGALPHCAGCA